MDGKRQTIAMKLSERDTLLAALLTLGETGRLEIDQGDNPAYISALCDLLQMLRLVRAEGNWVEVDGETARLFVRSMAAHLSDGVAMALDWHAPLSQGTAAHGTQLLTDIELLRKDRVSNPTPVREIVAVNAIFKAARGGRIYLLMQYDEQAHQFQLIGGKRDPDDLDAAHTVLREISEELALPGLHVPEDLTLAPLGERFEQISLSPTYGVVTSYHISFFHVLRMRFQPPIDGLTRWIDLDDVRRGMLPDGRKVSDLAVQSLGEYLETLEDSTLGPIQVES